MKYLQYAFAIGLLSAAASVKAAEVKLLPADIALSAPGATQRVILVVEDGKHIVGDSTPRATFVSSNPAVATVSETGVVTAVGDGDAVITGSIDGKPATAKVKVSKTKDPYSESFRNHIIPILTRGGCNSGACHGALAGKGGLKLSLRGYDPDTDYFVLTRQAGGRRIDRLEPARSLLLRKPTLATEHAGGLKIPAGTADYQILADWIAAGAPGPRSDDPMIQRLEVFPPAATLKPGDAISVLVRAWYSDGHSEDVTRWAKFASSEELVVKIDEAGQA